MFSVRSPPLPSAFSPLHSTAGTADDAGDNGHQEDDAAGHGEPQMDPHEAEVALVVRRQVALLEGRPHIV